MTIYKLCKLYFWICNISLPPKARLSINPEITRGPKSFRNFFKKLLITSLRFSFTFFVVNFFSLLSLSLRKVEHVPERFLQRIREWKEKEKAISPWTEVVNKLMKSLQLFYFTMFVNCIFYIELPAFMTWLMTLVSLKQGHLGDFDLGENFFIYLFILTISPFASFEDPFF